MSRSRRHQAQKSTLQEELDYCDDLAAMTASRRQAHLVELLARLNGKSTEEMRAELERYANESRN